MSQLSRAFAPANSSPRFAAVVGLDIGARRVKQVTRVWRRGGWRVVSAGCLRDAAAALDDPRALARRVADWLEDQPAPPVRAVVCALPASIAGCEAIDTPPAAAGDPRGAVQDALATRLGPAAKDAVFDFWQGEPAADGKPAALHAAWAPRAYVEGFAHQMARRGFECRAVDAAPLAAARLDAARLEADRLDAAARPDDPAETDPRGARLVVDARDNVVSLTLAADHVAVYTRGPVCFAPASAIEYLAHGFQVSAEAAETLLADHGLPGERGLPGGGAGRRAAPLERAIESQLGEWLRGLETEISRTLSFLRHARGARAVARLLLCGGGACARGLDDWLRRRLAIPTRRVDLPRDWTWEAAEPFSPIYASALALTRWGETR